MKSVGSSCARVGASVQQYSVLMVSDLCSRNAAVRHHLGACHPLFYLAKLLQDVISFYSLPWRIC